MTLAAGMGGAALIILLASWIRQSRSGGDRSLGSLVTAMDWSLALAYGVLTIVAVSLANWVVFHATFGRVHPDGPSLAFGGLTVAVVDFAREFRPDDGISTQLFELGMTALALTGMFLLVRSSGRDGPLA